jgi:hypothetical protein
MKGKEKGRKNRKMQERKKEIKIMNDARKQERETILLIAVFGIFASHSAVIGTPASYWGSP